MTRMAQKGPRKRLRGIRFAYEVSRWGTFIFRPTVDPKKVGFCALLSPSWTDPRHGLNEINHYHK